MMQYLDSKVIKKKSIFMKYLPFQHVEILNIYKNINGVFLSNNSREQIKRRGVAMYRGLPASVWGPVSVLRISPRDHNDAADDETQKQRGIVHWKPVTIHTVQSKQAFQVIDALNHRLSCCYFFFNNFADDSSCDKNKWKEIR